MIDRRALIVGGVSGVATTAFLPGIAFAAARTKRRFVFIIQRGAADGMHIVPPLGDPAYAGLRGPFHDSLEGAQKVDGTFALHPELTRIGQLFAHGQALAVHAVASVYRDRSHFDGQNILETGSSRAYTVKTGWLNRLIGTLPRQDRKALALATEIPLGLRGPAAVSSYAPSRLPEPGEDLLMRVSDLYSGDPQLSALWQEALSTQQMVERAGDLSRGRSGETIGRIAASLMAPADGVRIMMIETGGWDTHSAQAGRLDRALHGLDAMVGALADGLGNAWRDTLVLVATEFGRTAAVNGTNGTDHGTASAAFLLGGSLRGGRVIADWPGLGAASLYEGRDLRPTAALEAVITGALSQHFALDPQVLARALYPSQPHIRPIMI